MNLKLLSALGPILLAAACAHSLPSSTAVARSSTAARDVTTQGVKSNDNKEIRPFKAHVREEVLVDMKKRIAATRWPDRETVQDRTQGARLAKVQSLAHYWATGYDWRKAEAKLNALPQFMTEIDGLDIHFIHVQLASSERDAAHHDARLAGLGLRAHRRSLVRSPTPPHTVAARRTPSISSFRRCRATASRASRTTTGWNPTHIARAWNELMGRLGYKHYVAQGGDWGSVIVHRWRSRRRRDSSASTSICRRPCRRRSRRRSRLASRRRRTSRPRRRPRYARLDSLYKKGGGYAAIMVTRPQTLGYGLSDSPAGLAALIYDKFADWTYTGGEPERSLTQ